MRKTTNYNDCEYLAYDTRMDSTKEFEIHSKPDKHKDCFWFGIFQDVILIK